MKRFGPRISTQQRLARFFRPKDFFSAARVSLYAGPRTWTHPPGVLQRGITTGIHYWETKGEQTGNMKNGKMKKIISINFKLI